MTLGLWQLYYNGLTIGPGTPYANYKIEGFRGPSDSIDVGDVAKVRQDGMFPGWGAQGKRVTTLTIDVVASDYTLDTLESTYMALASAFVPISDPSQLQPLKANLSPLWPNSRYSMSRVTKAPVVIDMAATAGLYKFMVEFTSPDSYIFDDILQSASTSTWVGSDSDPLACVNADAAGNPGNATISPTFIIEHVGLTNISLSGGGVLLPFTGSPATGAGWTINCQNHTITDSSNVGQMTAISPGYIWPTIGPGASTSFTVVGSPGAASAEVQYRAAWAWA